MDIQTFEIDIINMW